MKINQVKTVVWFSLLWSLSCGTYLQAVTITGYSSEANDRFESGFPLNPVNNTSESFVGSGFDWSGVAWSTTTFPPATSYKGFGLLSPKHFLTAQHYEYGSEMTQGVHVMGSDGVVRTSDVSSISNTGHGVVLTNFGNTNPDIAVGTLEQALDTPSTIARYGVLDLNPGSNSDSTTPYDNLDLLLYGRSNTTNGSPRTGVTTPDLIFENGGDPTQTVIRTTRDDVQLQGGDSGSPALHGWTNPNGAQELTLLGLNSAISDDHNFLSFMATSGAMAATNAIMTPDGYALKVVGNPVGTWTGGPGPQGSNLGRSQNWSGSFSDQFVAFNADNTSELSINVNENVNLRGLYFIATGGSGDGFTFSGANTLTVGRGGSPTMTMISR